MSSPRPAKSGPGRRDLTARDGSLSLPAALRRPGTAGDIAGQRNAVVSTFTHVPPVTFPLEREAAVSRENWSGTYFCRLQYWRFRGSLADHLDAVADRNEKDRGIGSFHSLQPPHPGPSTTRPGVVAVFSPASAKIDFLFAIRGVCLDFRPDAKQVFAQDLSDVAVTVTPFQQALDQIGIVGYVLESDW